MFTYAENIGQNLEQNIYNKIALFSLPVMDEILRMLKKVHSQSTNE